MMGVNGFVGFFFFLFANANYILEEEIKDQKEDFRQTYTYNLSLFLTYLLQLRTFLQLSYDKINFY